MNPISIDLEIGGATLVAVPAVHFRVPFTAAVNALCRDPATRPDAIAVELGPIAVSAARLWMEELGVGPKRPRRLPCMLGLSHENRLVHPAVRERAMELQRTSGCELHRLPPQLLERDLGFRGLRVLPLSPTDSIVEAVRCAVELGVPLYGVDVEESADSNAPPLIGEDPWLAMGNIVGYVERNARRALAHHDPIIDTRREVVMASRLKAILARHARVLWTGGLGHWVRLAGLLKDPLIRPATRGIDPPTLGAVGEWQRVVIHPSIAVQHLEVPMVAWNWERSRQHPRLGPTSWQRAAEEPQVLLARVLDRTYRSYFRGKSNGAGETVKRQDWAAGERFEQLLTGEMRLGLKVLPDLALVLACARATLSAAFCERLTRELLRFPWARPDQVDGTSLLQRPEAAPDGAVSVSGATHVHLPSLVQGGQPLVPDPNLSWDWPSLPSGGAEESVRRREGAFTWRPWERLATALSAQASGRVARRQRVRQSVPFDGQLLEGLDARQTVRAHARGQDQIFVRDTRKVRASEPRALIDAFPVIWIFDRESEQGGEFEVLRTHLPWLLDAAYDRAALQRLVVEEGKDLVDLVIFGARELGIGSSGISAYHSRGWLLYRPQCPTLRQEAAWMVRTQAPARPTFSNGSSGALPPEVRRALDTDGGPRYGQLGWQDELVRLALAFGGRGVTVVAPQGFSASPEVRALAAGRGQTIGYVPLCSFSAEQVARCRVIHMVPATVRGAEARLVYRGHPERDLGESEDRYKELVPEHWRPFLW